MIAGFSSILDSLRPAYSISGSETMPFHTTIMNNFTPGVHGSLSEGH